MLDFGWSEMFLIFIIALFLIGPDDIPKVMIAVGRVFRRLQYIKFALSQQFEDIMREADLNDLRHSVNFEAQKHETAIASGEFDEAQADAEHLVVEALPHPPQKEGNA